MPRETPKHLLHARRTLGHGTIALAFLCLVIGSAAFLNHDRAFARRLPNKAQNTPWRILSQDEISAGTVIPPDTNVVFHLPANAPDTLRETLFGHRGWQVRYWGYCFPQNYNPRVVPARDALPGKLFLSEAERAARVNSKRKDPPAFSVYNLPGKKDIQRGFVQPSAVKHEVETFTAGMMCYIQTSRALSIGLDLDDDLLNDRIESDAGTSPTHPDTDGDGITDGIEFLTHTIPTLRDTDGDGVIDGIEDGNWNGKVNEGETNPRNKDSDRDGLCDGICRVKLANRQHIFLGEDRNLNGAVDAHETDPRKVDTDDDRIRDMEEVMDCLRQNKTDCP